MPDVPVTLVPWFNAKDNPPEDSDMDEPVREVLVAIVRDGQPWSFSFIPVPVIPNYLRLNWEVWWCDPSPPDMSDPLGPLTVRDMWRLYRLAQEDEAASVLEEERVAAMRLAARLRRALEAAEKGAA